MAIALHWFRRDLRLHDHQALCLAGDAGRRVVCAFILDPRILERPDTGAARLGYLLESLRELDGNLRRLGSALVIRRGDAVAEIPRLARELEAELVTAVRDVEPFARHRDARVDAALRQDGRLGLRLTDEQLFTIPDRTRKPDGSPYAVFTPFRRRFDSLLAEAGAGSEARPQLGSLLNRDELPATTALPTAAGLGFIDDQRILEPGEAAARRRLAEFLTRIDGVGRYAELRNRPDLAATSRLSADLRFGCLSVRAVLRGALEARAGADSATTRHAVDAWIGEVAWRDFYGTVLWNFPQVETQEFRPEFRALVCDDDPTLLEAWATGATGYPIVDAAMQQLRAEAYMHNRCRMIVASFLTKDLHLDYRRGERHFMRSLVDGDMASNNGGWQWVASTGTDPQPYFRIFNPVLQGERYDPEGVYVKRWLPALRLVPAKFVHKPWMLSALERESCGLGGGGYPDRIVDHDQARAVALQRYGIAARGGGPPASSPLRGRSIGSG